MGGSSGGGTGPNLFQNYWVDLEVTLASTFTPAQPDLPQQIPHPLFYELLEVAAYRMDGAGQPVLTNATAGLASGTGAAQAPAVTVVVNAGLATGTGTAQSPLAAIGANAGLASGTGAAQSPSVVIAANAGLATGTGTAQQPSAAVTASAALASGAGAAQSGTVAITVFAGLATGTGGGTVPDRQHLGIHDRRAGIRNRDGAAAVRGDHRECRARDRNGDGTGAGCWICA